MSMGGKGCIEIPHKHGTFWKNSPRRQNHGYGGIIKDDLMEEAILEDNKHLV